MTDSLLRARYRLVLLLTSLFLGISLATRLVLLTAHHAFVESGMAFALAVGEVYDLLAGLWLAVPLVLFLSVLPERWFRSRVQRVLLRLWIFASLFGLLFVAAAEAFFFAEFDGRFNFVAVDYLMYPTEVVTNIWESYPTAAILAGIAGLSAATLFLLDRQVHKAWEQPVAPWRRVGVAGGYACVLAGLSLIIAPSLAQVSHDRALNEIASNGYYSFWEALLGSSAPYEGMYATRPAAAVAARLQRLLAEPAAIPASFDSGSTRRHVRALGAERKMNVVVVLEESLGSEFIGALHPGPRSLTPQYDALAREGLLFTRAYSTGNRTIRAIEATTSSLPPLPGVSIVRRPQSEGLFTLPALLRSRGYQTVFVYGGRALFDGMGRYLRNNGVDRIVEQKDYPGGTFKTAWGVADEAIFGRALAEMDVLHAAGRPFYTLVLSVSNHRPFRFPETAIHPEPGLNRRENAVRYADYALGCFMRQARSHAFFDNTLFVLMGDHGARVYGAAEIPLPSYEVPILFYAPAAIPAGRRIDILASSLDVPPTILGVLGMSYDSKFFGHDLFRINPAAGRALMTHNNEIALMHGSRMAVLGLHGATALYDVTAGGALNPVHRPDAAGHALIEDAIAYYDGAWPIGPERMRLQGAKESGWRGRAASAGPSPPSPLPHALPPPGRGAPPPKVKNCSSSAPATAPT